MRTGAGRGFAPAVQNAVASVLCVGAEACAPPAAGIAPQAARGRVLLCAVGPGPLGLSRSGRRTVQRRL